MTPRILSDAADLALEATVVLSFSKVGPAVRRRLDGWTDLDRIDASGRRILLTGVTSGIGRAAAEQLARQGADLIVLGRDRERTEGAADEIAGVTGTERAQVVVADMSDLDAVRAAGAEAVADGRPLDALLHNAGALLNERRETPDGTEMTVATSVVGPVVLTAAVLPALVDARPGRVVWMSSGGMYTQRLDVDRLEMPADGYDGTTAYARAKRAQVVLAREMARRADPATLVAHAMHPGWAATPGVDASLPGFAKVMGPLLRDPADGADTLAWLATADEATASTGDFWLDRRRRWAHRLPTTPADDGEVARLWAWVCDRAGLDEGWIDPT